MPLWLCVWLLIAHYYTTVITGQEEWPLLSGHLRLIAAWQKTCTFTSGMKRMGLDMYMHASASMYTAGGALYSEYKYDL